MLTFEAPSRPSPLTIREFTRPRFDGNLERLRDWIAGLRTAGVRQSAPALIMALDNLRKSDIPASRKLSILSVLKEPILKTCAGLPKPTTLARPDTADDGSGYRRQGVTLEQRLYRALLVNLNQALRQLDQENFVLSKRLQQKREWAIRNIFRFANRLIRYATLWQTPIPEGTWRDLHELTLYLAARRPNPLGVLSRVSGPTAGTSGFDHERDYKALLLFGLAARMNEPLVRKADFLSVLDGWASQTSLEDPHQMLGRIGLILVEIAEDSPPRRRHGSLDQAFHGWVLLAPTPYLNQLEHQGGGFNPAMFRTDELMLTA